MGFFFPSLAALIINVSFSSLEPLLYVFKTQLYLVNVVESKVYVQVDGGEFLVGFYCFSINY